MKVFATLIADKLTIASENQSVGHTLYSQPFPPREDI
jgi:hypothetical protein